jgi:subtilisin-like proprotein convertase family protein
MMRKIMFVLGIVALSASVAASPSGDARWIELKPGTSSEIAEIRVISETDDQIAVELEVPGFSVSEMENDRGRFSLIDVEGCGQLRTVGKARLPVFRRAIEIPQGSSPEITIVEQTTVRYDLPAMGLARRIFPAQEPIEKLPGAREAAEFRISDEFYTSGVAYPTERVRIAEIGQMRGHRFAMIEIAPVTYVPAEGVIEIVSRIKLRVIHRGADHAATQAITARYASAHFERMASSMLLNYTPPSAKAVPDWPVGYLIITDPDFYDEVLPLAAWKTAKGYRATVTSTSDIPGGVTTTAIKAYIKDAWQNWDIPPGFVLLVGDVADIPNWTGVGDNNPPTDLYYATMTDPDYIPDLGIGRFSVTSPAQATALVEKTIEYEKTLFGSTVWLKKAVFMASEDNYTITEGTHNYVISTYMDPAGYASDKLYCHTYNATTQQVSDAFNEGRGLGIYSGHGATTYWDDGPYFTQSNVDALTNLDMYPFVQSYACYTGRYTEPECFSETWIRKIDKAGLGFWGSSVTSYWDEDDVLEKGVFQALFEDSLTWMSGMLDQGKWYLHEYYGGAGSTQRYYEMYNLMGDPSVDIWTEYPQTMTVTHAGTCPVGAPSYQVEVTDGGAPLGDALACLDMPGEVYETAYTDPAGEATLILDPAPSTTGNMVLTVTRHNCTPVIDTIDVVVPAVVTIVPDTIYVETPTAVTVTVLDTLSLPVENVVVRIDGWGFDPALTDTTDAAGMCTIVVDAPYGELLSVVGREIGESFDCFREDLVVIGASALPGPQVSARVDTVGLVGALTPDFKGTITGRTTHTGLDMFATGCGVDDAISSPADSAVLMVTPASLGTITVALAYPGYEVHLEDVSVIEARGMLAGTARDTSTGDSLPGVAVAVYPEGADTALTEPTFEVTTGADGSYASPDSVPVGPYDLYASKFGYLDFTGSPFVRCGANVFGIDMTPAPSGTVAGTVTEDLTGKPITATIQIYRSDDLSLYSQTTSDSLAGGAYLTDPLPYFTYLFRISAQHYMTRSIYVTVDESSEWLDIELVPTEGNLLVIDDDTGSLTFAAKTGLKGEMIAFEGNPAAEGEVAKSASIIAQDLIDMGYDVTTETSATTDPATWPDYDVVIWSSGDDTSPVSVAAYRSNLNAYVATGGKLLIEGGEIGYDAAAYPGYPNFTDTTLHVTSWQHDSSGDLTLEMPTHPIATTPNALPTTLIMTYSNYGDQDALIPAGDSEVVFDWSSYNGQGGVLVYDDTPDPLSSQIVFFSFDYANVTDSGARSYLLENSVVHLLTPETPPDGSISGYVELAGETSYEGVIVSAEPIGLADTTDVMGNYSITDLFDGIYQVVATKSGFTDSTVTVEITGGAAVTDVNFTLYPVLEYMDSPEMAIPDNDSTGIRVYIDVPADADIATVDCYVDVTHSFRGDLIIELTSPEGTTVRLHDRSGSSADDINTWYDIETEPDGPGLMDDFTGEWAEGTWELWICDVASSDTGTLHTWGLRFSFPPYTSGVDKTDPETPKIHFLAKPHPNPFHGSALIRFGLPRSEDVKIGIFDVRGRLVTPLASRRYPPGTHSIVWDGTDAKGRRVADGVYFCRMRAGAFSASQPVILIH